MAPDDDPFFSPTHRPPTRSMRPAEHVCDFVRASDGAPMSMELRLQGESYGWEAVILERGELLHAHGGFPTEALAVQWAELEREAIEKGGA